MLAGDHPWVFLPTVADPTQDGEDHLVERAGDVEPGEDVVHGGIGAGAVEGVDGRLESGHQVTRGLSGPFHGP
ncbi:MAG: hypothetical protein EA340_01750 [Nitriliruptor sp.]|nr:MAG: hypothetical protein EA340_01750 [Nitriliruptor sp.]